MAKFNVVKSKPVVLNKEGGESYRPTDKLELTLRTMSFLMSGDQYYSKEKEVSDEISSLVKKISTKDPEFILKLAAYAREKMYLRSVPVYLLVEYAKQTRALKGAYRYVPKILRRADEPAEALAYYFKSSGSRKVPALLKKGIGEALNSFDAYQFGKYDRAGEVSLKDVIFLTHPKAKDANQQAIYDSIVAGTLETPITWETEVSGKGSTKEVWESVIPKMGYMALLRNLRNFEQKKVNMKPVYEKLTKPGAVMASKQFPYRFFSAYREVAESKTLDAIQTAMEISVANVPKIPGKTFIASDNSGSMHGVGPSKNSKVQNIEVASLFSAISQHVCEDSLVGAFGQTYADVPLSSKSTILDNMEKVMRKDVGHSTEAWKAIESVRRRGLFFDRMFVFSDMQCYTDSWGSSRDMRYELNLYRKEVNPKCRMYSFDLAQYGLLKFPEGDPLTCPIGGYSDSIFRLVPMFEEGRETMVKAIENYNPFSE